MYSEPKLSQKTKKTKQNSPNTVKNPPNSILVCELKHGRDTVDQCFDRLVYTALGSIYLDLLGILEMALGSIKLFKSYLVRIGLFKSQVA